MNRRKFVLSTGLIASASVLPNGATPVFAVAKDLSLTKPKKLKKGDTIGMITPASATTRDAFEKAVGNMKSLGFKVKYSENMNVRKGFLAGTDEQRLSDLHSMFEDPEIDGIICARGGYGSGRLLTKINYDLIRSNPKVFIGFSDITALLYAIHKKTGLICFHGPVGASEFSDFTTKGFEHVIMDGKSGVSFERPKDWKNKNASVYEFTSIVGGNARGKLVGGNLSLVCSMMGTPYDLGFDNKIVFLEEIGESPYRVDRMLTQLLNSGKLDKCAGLAMGVFSGCETKSSDPGFGLSTSLKDVLIDRFSQMGKPVAYGLPIGHIDDNSTLPFGTEASFDANEGELKLLETAVI